MAVREVTRLELEAPEEPRQAQAGPQPDEMRVQVIAVLHGLAAILAARLILLVALIGSIGLTAYAVHSSGGDRGEAITAAALYDGLVLIPIVVLAWRKS